MKYLELLKEKYVNYDIIFILFLILLMVSTINPIKLDYYTKTTILPLCVFGIIFIKYLKNWILWLLISISLTSNLIFNYFFTANHLFLATYFSWSIALVLLCGNNFHENLRSCSKWLLVVVLGMASIHKLTSPQFTDGSFISFQILTGLRKFPGLSLHWPELSQVNHENLRNLFSLLERPSFNSSVEKIAYPDLQIFFLGKIFSWVIAAYEIILLVFFLIYPKFQKISHLLLILFVVFTYLYTNENIFFSMLCILAFVLTEKENKKIRLIYIAFIVLLLTMYTLNFRASFLQY